MALKARYNVSLPDHVSAELEKHAKSVGAAPTEYAGDVIRWWFGQGCPPVTPDEIELRKRSRVDVWKLNPKNKYLLEGDAVVLDLMTQLGVPNLFARMIEHDEVHAVVAFDNHPTHWIMLHLWKGHGKASGNGLLFDAVPKATTSRDQMLVKLKKLAVEIEAKETIEFSQIPEPVATQRTAPNKTN